LPAAKRAIVDADHVLGLDGPLGAAAHTESASEPIFPRRSSHRDEHRTGSHGPAIPPPPVDCRVADAAKEPSAFTGRLAN
jgi:hypothetical protein